MKKDRINVEKHLCTPLFLFTSVGKKCVWTGKKWEHFKCNFWRVKCTSASSVKCYFKALLNNVYIKAKAEWFKRSKIVLLEMCKGEMLGEGCQTEKEEGHRGGEGSYRISSFIHVSGIFFWRIRKTLNFSIVFHPPWTYNVLMYLVWDKKMSQCLYTTNSAAGSDHCEFSHVYSQAY